MNFYDGIENDEEKEKKDKQAQPDRETLLKTRTVYLFSEVNRESANAVINALVLLDSEDSGKPIKLLINSPGGDVDSGFAIYDMVKFVKAPVLILGTGLVASAAALIYSSVPKERRFALPHSTYLIHQPLAKMQGVAIDVELYAKKLDEVKALINEILAEACGQDIKKVTADTDRDCHMSAVESVKYGLVGKVISSADELKV